MPRVLRPLLLALLACLAGRVSGADEPRRGDAVVLQLVDGRVARGTLGSDVDADPLVLDTQLERIRLVSRFPALRVVRIESAETFDERNGTIRIDAPPPPNVPELPAPDASDDRTRATSEPAPRVRTLSITGSLANWDADPEADGLLLRVLPLDGWGNVVPAEGSLSVALEVQPLATRRRIPWRRREVTFFTSDRWNVQLQPIDFGPYGADVRLPFRRLHPEFDLDVAPQGLLRARLVVPGDGVFEASDANVRLRELSRYRDELEQLTGRRFSPRERIGHWPNAPSSPWRMSP